MSSDETMPALSAEQVTRFIRDGFVRLDGAFPRELADQGRAILWRDTKCDPDDPTTWTQPVIRLGHYGEEPFRKAANAPLLHAAFDQLVGRDAGVRAQISARFRCAFRIRRIPAMPAGMSISASPAKRTIRTSRRIFLRGA